MLSIPKKSKAAKKLGYLSSYVRRERIRCAKIAYELGIWCKDKYPDEPEQWIRCEQIFRDILKDQNAMFPILTEEKK